MGTLHNGLLGGFSGKVGPVVGVTLRNKTILRSLPQPSNKPRSPKQLGNQSSFGLVSSFLSKYRTFINAYFTPDADGKAPYGSAMSYHKLHATQKENGMYYINYPQVLISKGALPGILGGTLSTGADDTLQLTWTDNSDQPLAAATDLLTVAAYAPALHRFYFFEGLCRTPRQQRTPHHTPRLYRTLPTALGHLYRTSQTPYGSDQLVYRGS